MTEALAQTVLQMGITNYQPLRSYAVTHFTHFITYALFRYARYTVVTHVSYANSVRPTLFIRRPLRSIRKLTMWRRFRPMWSDVVISLQT